MEKEGEHAFTKSGRMKKVELDTICQWILDVWEALPTDLIVRLFKKCGITNDMDGTEDDLLWEENTDDNGEVEDESGDLS